MKATLTIEVPDDFKKGSHDCKFFVGVDTREWCGIQFSTKCNAYNCPLEIQDEPEEDRCIGCIHRGVFNDMGICLKCNDYNFYKQENNQ